MFAFDHRNQYFELAREAGAPESRLRELKSLLVRAVAETELKLGLRGHVGALVDDTYGEDALAAATGRGWWLGRPVEVPGSAAAGVRGRALHRDAARGLAPGAGGEVPGALPPRRRGRGPPGAGDAAPRPVRRRAGERTRAAPGGDPAGGPASRRPDRAPDPEAALQHRDLPGVVEARADAHGDAGGSSTSSSPSAIPSAAAWSSWA